ncbi:putative aldolase [Xylariaceae sp. FL0804]|nr:putative aldolase [Xylariaceae sp. FL0804]
MAPSAVSPEALPTVPLSKNINNNSAPAASATTAQDDVEPLAAMAHRGKALPSIPTFDSPAAQRRWQLEHMAGAFRVFGRDGYCEGISGHISVRDPEFADRFWINPLGVHFSLMRASDMICVDHAGDVVGGNVSGSINAAGFQIHSAVHAARPDVHAICHTHSVHGRAWSAFGRPLEMLNQDVCNLYGAAQAVYADYGGIANDGTGEGERIAAALGPRGKAAVLLNHGLLTVGRTVDEAAFLFGLMERSCRVQLLADAAAAGGLKKHLVADEEAEYNFRMASTPECLFVEFQPYLNYEDRVSGGDYKQ